MTKSDIVEKIHSKTGLNKKESSLLLESVLDILKDTLESGEKVKITNFGNFEIKLKNSRKGRNPQTSETIILPARKVMTFKPSSTLKTRINNIKS